MVSPRFDLPFLLFKVKWRLQRLCLWWCLWWWWWWWLLLVLVFLLLLLLLLLVGLFHGCSVELESSDNLSSGLSHVQEPLLVRPAGVESPSNLFLVLLGLLGLLCLLLGFT